MNYYILSKYQLGMISSVAESLQTGKRMDANKMRDHAQLLQALIDVCLDCPLPEALVRSESESEYSYRYLSDTELEQLKGLAQRLFSEDRMLPNEMRLTSRALQNVHTNCRRFT